MKRVFLSLLPVLTAGFLYSKPSYKIVQNSIEFYYYGIDVDRVYIAFEHDGYIPRAMYIYSETNNIKVFFYRIDIKRETYKYRFLVDGLWIRDPLNPNYETDIFMNEYSIIDLSSTIKKPFVKMIDYFTYRFSYFSKDAKSVYIMGNFNYYNPEDMPLKNDGDGWWHIDIKFYGDRIIYKYIEDGRGVLDPRNSRVISDRVGEVFSFVDIIDIPR